MPLQIFVDADACPIVMQRLKLAYVQRRHTPVVAVRWDAIRLPLGFGS